MYLEEEFFRNEIHSLVVGVLTKSKQYVSSTRLIDEATYHIYKQGNSWIKLKDILSNLEVFCRLYQPADKYILNQYW